MSRGDGGHRDGEKPVFGDGGNARSVSQQDTNNDSLLYELFTIKSTMDKMVTMMASMQNKMDSMMEKLNIMETNKGNVKNNSSISSQAESMFEEKLDLRFDRVDDRLRHQEALLRNQMWEYSAPPPSPEYWQSIDHDAMQTTRTKIFLESIQSATEKMRDGQEDGYVRVFGDSRIEHNDVFMPHWREFALALEQYQYTLKCSTLEYNSLVHLDGTKLPSSVLELLSWGLRSTHFRKLTLSHNQFGLGGIKFVLDYMQHNHILKELSIKRNLFETNGTVHRLSAMIMEHPSIEKVELVACIGEGLSGFGMMRSIMAAGVTKLTTIKLTRNCIHTGGRTFLSDFLATNPILQNLDLERNQLNDEDAISIASALKHNTNLHCLNVDFNLLTRDGWDALCKAAFDDTSLNTAADLNHTCCIRYPKGLEFIRFVEHEGDSLIINHLCEPKSARGKKIYSILSSRNIACTNVQYFDEVPIEIMPTMLFSIHNYSEYYHKSLNRYGANVKCLSIVYEILRKWEKGFSVYESLSGVVSNCQPGQRS